METTNPHSKDALSSDLKRQFIFSIQIITEQLDEFILINKSSNACHCLKDSLGHLQVFCENEKDLVFCPDYISNIVNGATLNFNHPIQIANQQKKFSRGSMNKLAKKLFQYFDGSIAYTKASVPRPDHYLGEFTLKKYFEQIKDNKFSICSCNDLINDLELMCDQIIILGESLELKESSTN